MAIVPLDQKKHAALTFQPLEDYAFTAAMNCIPLMLFEAADAAHCFAIAFPSPHSAMPHALLGLGGKNIFVDGKGQWIAPYMPLAVANYPFSIIAGPVLENSDKKQEMFLAIDETAPHFQKKDGQPLYGPDGKPTETLQRITTALNAQLQQHKIVEKFLAELALSNVLREQTVTITAKGKKRAVAGLRVADRKAVMALPDETLARWAKNGLLELLHAHWWSMRNLQTLLEDPSCPAAGETKN